MAIDRKAVLFGGGALALLFLLGKKSTASASTPPALPAPMPKVVPKVPEGAPVVERPIAPLHIDASADDQAAARAAAAAAAQVHPTMLEPAALPAASPLTSAQQVPAAPSQSISRLPPGYDPAAARRVAKSVANNVARSKYSYDRRMVRDFQAKAGLAPDGVYGGATRGALIYFGVPTPPKALFKPVDTVPYHPPG